MFCVKSSCRYVGNVLHVVPVSESRHKECRIFSLRSQLVKKREEKGRERKGREESEVALQRAEIECSDGCVMLR